MSSRGSFPILPRLGRSCSIVQGRMPFTPSQITGQDSPFVRRQTALHCQSELEPPVSPQVAARYGVRASSVIFVSIHPSITPSSASSLTSFIPLPQNTLHSSPSSSNSPCTRPCSKSHGRICAGASSSPIPAPTCLNSYFIHADLIDRYLHLRLSQT